MKVGNCVNLCTHGPTADTYVVRRTGRIVAVGTKNDIDTHACYDVMIDGKIAKFYMRPQVGTVFYLNVGNDAFCIRSIF